MIAIQRLVPLAAALLALAGLAPAPAAAQEMPADDVHGAAQGAARPGSRGRTVAPGLRQQPWSERTLELAATLPVQDRGRIKPLGTLAGFQLLKTNGKRKLTTPAGEELTPIAWLLDCLFFPESALDHEVFLVQNADVLSSVGFDVSAKKRRARWSYTELEPVRQALMQRAENARQKEGSQRTLLDRQTLDLATNVREFEELLHMLDLARHEFRVAGGEGMQAIWPDRVALPLSEVLADAGPLADLAVLLTTSPDAAGPADAVGFDALMNELDAFAASAHHGLALVPPPAGESHPWHEGHDAEAERGEEWMAPAELIANVFFGVSQAGDAFPVEEQLAVLADLEALTAARSDPAAFEGNLERLHDRLVASAEARGEYGKIPMEVAFYAGDYFTRALVFYLLGFLLIAFSWLRTPGKWLSGAIWLSLLSGTGLLVTGIVLRCIIRSRPPVSTLYETILFITAVAVVVCFVIEWIGRARIALATSSVLGALGMFLAMKYELREAATAGDTMPSLVAVLDTNFWLSTHVTTVTMGYAAGLLAAALAHVWLVARVFGFRGGQGEFYTSVARMVYGVLCFGLLFSVVGTILGGIWANYSWGRFWGWDPKENGALMICLWELLIIHARLGGYVRNFGLCVLAIVGGVVVAFSWWGVNLLGVGLHSYGFTDGVGLVLSIFYALEAGVLLGAGAWWLYDRGRTAALGGTSRI